MGSTAPLASLEESEVAARIRAGAADAEAELVRRFEPGLHAIAVVRSGWHAAPDLVQETLVAALANLRRGDWRGEGPLAAYLASILRRRIQRDRSRATAEGSSEAGGTALDTLPTPNPDPETTAERDEARLQVRSALTLLSAAHREVVIRHYFEDQTAEEIARVMRLPRGTVLSRLHYARQEIARRMNQKGGPRHKDHGRASR